MAAPKLLDQMRDKIRLHQYSPDTESAYLHSVKRYVLFHEKNHPQNMDKEEVGALLFSRKV
jgi:hypothetical protein